MLLIAERLRFELESLLFKCRPCQHLSSDLYYDYFLFENLRHLYYIFEHDDSFLRLMLVLLVIFVPVLGFVMDVGTLLPSSPA